MMDLFLKNFSWYFYGFSFISMGFRIFFHLTDFLELAIFSADIHFFSGGGGKVWIDL